MSGLFDGLDRLDLDAHVRRWTAPEVTRTAGAVSEWIGAAQMFAARIQRDPARLTGEQWRAVAEAWSALLAAAERATGPRHNEWLLRDLWLRANLLREVGAAPDVPLLVPGPVLDRTLDAMPMDPDKAVALAPRWRELDRAQVLSLRMVRRLLSPARAVAPLLADHPRRGEFEAWDRIADSLP
ncbi:hypothetical protein [Streptomyces sp. NPDC086519]|uniref:hypothetical protein n=1 Tax=Streptomyces sp. NPDC086519 TaxID=3154863 RepID=UPI00344114B8